MANKLRSRLQEQYQEMIEEQNSSAANQNFVDDVVLREESVQSEEKQLSSSVELPQSSRQEEPEIHYLARSYTLQTETKQKLRIRVRTERTSIKDYINKCLQKFF